MPKIKKSFFNMIMAKIDKDPTNKVVDALDWLKSLALRDEQKQQISTVRQVLANETNWRDLYIDFMVGLNPGVRNRIAYNFILSGLDHFRSKKNWRRIGASVPWAYIRPIPRRRCTVVGREYLKKNDMN